MLSISSRKAFEQHLSRTHECPRMTIEMMCHALSLSLIHIHYCIDHGPFSVMSPPSLFQLGVLFLKLLLRC